MTRRATSSPGTVGSLNPRFRAIFKGPVVLPNIIGGDPFAICAYEGWMQRSACLDVDPEIFYPDPGNPSASRAAKRICASCPVRQECLGHAIAKSEEYGIWGGMSARERGRADLPRRRKCRHCVQVFDAAPQVQFCSDECRRNSNAKRKLEYQHAKPKRLA